MNNIQVSTPLANASAENITNKLSFIQEDNLTAIKVIRCCVGIVISVLNIFGVIGLWRTQKIAKQARVLAINIAFSDLASGFLIIVHNTIDKGDLWLCQIERHFETLFVLSSLFSATSLAVDRFLSVKFAMKYQFHINTKRTAGFCVLLWVLASIVVVILYSVSIEHPTCVNYLTGIERIIGIAAVVPCLGLILFSYIGIILVTKKTIARVSIIDITTRQNMLRQNLKPSLKIAAISGVYLITYMSVIIVFMVLSINPQFPDRDVLIESSSIILSFQCLINPIIYAWRFKEYRIHMLFIFCYCNQRLRERAITMRKILLEPYMEHYDLRTRKQSTSV